MSRLNQFCRAFALAFLVLPILCNIILRATGVTPWTAMPSIYSLLAIAVGIIMVVSLVIYDRHAEEMRKENHFLEVLVAFKGMELEDQIMSLPLVDRAAKELSQQSLKRVELDTRRLYDHLLFKLADDTDMQVRFFEILEENRDILPSERSEEVLRDLRMVFHFASS